MRERPSDRLSDPEQLDVAEKGRDKWRKGNWSFREGKRTIFLVCIEKEKRDVLKYIGVVVFLIV